MAAMFTCSLTHDNSTILILIPPSYSTGDTRFKKLENQGSNYNNMLVKGIFVLLTIYITAVLTNSEFEENNNNGWIPVSNKNIYDQVKREFTHEPEYMKVEHTNDDVSLLKEEAMKIITPEENARSGKDYVYPKYEEVQNIQNYEQCSKLGASICPEAITEENIKANEKKYDLPINSNRSPKKTRKAKGISDRNIDNNLDSEHNKNKPIIYNKFNEDFITKEIVPTEHDKNTYEVTEERDSIEAEQSEFNKKSTYADNIPKVNVDFNNLSLTSGLLNILSKYNINASDKLPNYALSRTNRNENLLKPSNNHQPNQFMIPYRYNSLNHLSVDPLLAVFLSNYGHYLPGIYGIKNNYNNLYGYLASNNIHNNMPFGLYKIFSDTDPSH